MCARSVSDVRVHVSGCLGVRGFLHFLWRGGSGVGSVPGVRFRRQRPRGRRAPERGRSTAVGAQYQHTHGRQRKALLEEHNTPVTTWLYMSLPCSLRFVAPTSRASRFKASMAVCIVLTL